MTNALTVFTASQCSLTGWSVWPGITWSASSEHTTNDDYVQLGDYYYELKENDAAEQAYKKAVAMVPSRFRSSFNLYQCYKETGQTHKAYMAGNSILSLPVKISSPFIDHVKTIIIHDFKMNGRK